MFIKYQYDIHNCSVAISCPTTSNTIREVSIYELSYRGSTSEIVTTLLLKILALDEDCSEITFLFPT